MLYFVKAFSPKYVCLGWQYNNRSFLTSSVYFFCQGGYLTMQSSEPCCCDITKGTKTPPGSVAALPTAPFFILNNARLLQNP